MKNRALPIRAVIIALVMIYAALLLISALGQLRSAEADTAELSAQISELRGENERLRQCLDRQDDDALIEQIARLRLGLTDKDDVVFYDTHGYGG